jgi:hypothetical protein
MNDKIKELAEQALKYADMQSDFLCESENRDIETSETQTLAFEKFAELIVKECASIYNKIDNGNAHLGTENYLEALQKHFGVE